MSTWRKVGCCLIAAIAAFGAFGGTTLFVDGKSQGAAEPYGTPDTAATTITAAMTYVGTLGDEAFPVEIRVAEGKYTETGFTLDKAISIVGMTGDPKDVEIVDAVAGKRAFTLGHPDAVVRDLTVSGTGLNSSGGEGGHVRMTAGTVENCVLTGGCAGKKGSNAPYSTGHGGNIWMSDGRLVRCQVRSGQAISYNATSRVSYGAGIYASGGLVENCLICENTGEGFNVEGGGLYAAGGVTVVNCTFVNNKPGNRAASGGGIQLASDAATVVNCVFFGNGGDARLEYGNVRGARFSHCASSVTNDACDTWQLMSETDFIAYRASDYRLSCDSELVDGGTRDAGVYPGDVSTLDLDGRPRVTGEEIDIGCHEVDQRSIVLSGRVSSYDAFEGSNLVFLASHLGTDAGVTYRWDFGNGASRDTMDGETTYAYAASGLYTVRVSASADGGTSWTDPFVLPVKVVVAPDVLFVDSASPSPTFPYKTRETAARTFNEALSIMTNNVSGGYATVEGATIRVCAGAHADTGVVLRHGIRVVGDTGDPKDVTIVDSVKGKRAFTLDHPDAVVRDLAVSGTGFCQSGGKGGHVNMTDGKIENCVITGGIAGKSEGGSPTYNEGFGGNVWMSGGRLVRSQILNGQAIDSVRPVNNSRQGAGVYASGGVIESCLIAGNGNASYKVSGGGVYAAGPVTIVNCTVVDNIAGTPSDSAGGIQLEHDDATVVNCILYGNGGDARKEFGTRRLGRFSHCASSVTNGSCATWRMMAESDFVGYAAQDFHLVQSSPLVDAGAEDGVCVGELDLDGLVRVSGKAIDLGCYEVDQSRLSVGGALASYTAFEGSNVTFTAAVLGDAESLVIRWDCGDGTVFDTDELASRYAYPTSGLFTVRVAASADGGAHWTDWTTLPTKVVVAPDVLFVDSASPSPAFPYKTRETAARTFRDALAALTNNVSGGYATVTGATVRVCAGTHADTGVTLRHGIRVVGDTGDPADVEIVDNAAGRRAFTIEHPDAVVRDLTVTGKGLNTGSGEGGHVRMTAGTVENCVFRDGYAGKKGVNPGYGYGSGGNVYMTGGRLSRCVLTGGWAIEAKLQKSYGGGLYVSGGTVDSCFLRGNGVAGSSTCGSGIYIAGAATVANCTVVDNATTGQSDGASGIQIAHADAKVVNCILFGNGGTPQHEFGSANLSRFSHCASSVTNGSCATWRMMAESDFVGYAAQDFHLVQSSPLVDAGAEDGVCVGELDLDGLARVSGKAIDLGCYEIDQSRLSCGGYPSVYGSFEGSNVTFTAMGRGGSGSYAYRWDFGDGEERETSEAVYGYAYPTSGLFTVRVAASDDDGANWCDWAVVPTKIVVTPKEMFVDSSSAGPKYPYKTRSTAARTIADALAALTNNVSGGYAYTDGAVIRICRGTHTESGVVLRHGIRVVGDTGDPKDVTIVDSVKGKRAFTLDHPDAVVRDLTVSGTGFCQSGGKGGHVNMTDGKIENCVITGGIAGKSEGGSPTYNEGFGGNVWMSGGRLVRSQILNGQAIDSVRPVNNSRQGAGVYASGGVIESCLIAGNGNASYKVSGGGVYAAGPVAIVNCTVIDNVAGTPSDSAGGIQLASDAATVVNCVLFGNGGDKRREYGNVCGTRFSHCASSVDNEECATWQVIDESAFRNWSRREEDLKFLVPRTGKPLVGTGTDADGYAAAGGTSSVDLLGKNRQFGRRLDIGCLESQAGGTLIFVR